MKKMMHQFYSQCSTQCDYHLGPRPSDAKRHEKRSNLLRLKCEKFEKNNLGKCIIKMHYFPSSLIYVSLQMWLSDQVADGRRSLGSSRRRHCLRCRRLHPGHEASFEESCGKTGNDVRTRGTSSSLPERSGLHRPTGADVGARISHRHPNTQRRQHRAHIRHHFHHS